MNTITTTLKPAADGSLHLPVPPELLGSGWLQVVARVQPAAPPSRRGSAGAWARQARGIARLEPGEDRDDARIAYHREKSRHSRPPWYQFVAQTLSRP